MKFLSVKDLSLSIQGNLILDSIEFEANSPGFLSIIGPNGAGKSAFIKCLLGLIEPTKGELLLYGNHIQNTPKDWIGYVPQFKTFDRSFPARAIDLIVSGLRYKWPAFISRSEKIVAEEALEKVHARHLLSRQVSTLSGGELQKCYLARALIKKRRLIILDEPSTGIDTFGEADLYQILEDQVAKQSTDIIMVTHDLAVARHHSTEVLLLNKKQISFGTPSNALSEEKINRAFGHSEHHHLEDNQDARDF